MMSKLNIWLLKDGESVPSEVGFQGRLMRTGQLGYYLSERDHEVTWWTSNFDHFQKKFHSNAEMTEVNANFHVRCLPGAGYSRNISFARIAHNKKIAAKFLEIAAKSKRPDIIVASLPTIELAYAAMQFSKAHDIPFLVDLRDMWPDIYLQVLPRRLEFVGRILLKRSFQAVKDICREATGLIGITEDFLQWGLDYAGRPRHELDGVFPLTNSLRQEPLSEQSLVEKAKKKWSELGLSEGQTVLSFVGQLNASTDLAPAIASVKRSEDPSLRLVIAGDGPKRESYLQLASGDSRILIPGFVDKYMLVTLLEQSSLGLAPYILRKDFLSSIPNKSLEYLSFGLPVLTSLKNGTLGSLLQEHQCGLCYEGEEDLQTQIDDLMKNPEQMEQLSQKAQTLFDSEFSPNQVFGRFMDKIEQVAKKKVPTSTT